MFTLQLKSDYGKEDFQRLCFKSTNLAGFTILVIIP